MALCCWLFNVCTCETIGTQCMAFLVGVSIVPFTPRLQALFICHSRSRVVLRFLRRIEPRNPGKRALLRFGSAIQLVMGTVPDIQFTTFNTLYRSYPPPPLPSPRYSSIFESPLNNQISATPCDHWGVCRNCSNV